MVDKCADLDSVDQLRNPAHVVAMIVGNQDVVDLLEARLMSRGQDPVGVATFISRPACVDEQRLSGGTHDQCGLAALHVDEVNIEGFRLLRLSKHPRRDREKN